MSAAVPGARFVDPKVLARIGNLELVARSVVDGFINGLHRSPYFGASVDFAEHRGYVPGDDIRRVDWRLVRAHGPVLHQGVRSGLELQLLGSARRLEVDGIRQRRDDETRLRAHARGMPHLPRAPAERSRWSGRVRQRDRGAGASLRETHGSRAARAESVVSVAAGVAAANPCTRWRSISDGVGSSS